VRKFTSDDLAVMLDEDLVKLESSIKSQIGRQRKNGDSTHGEVDLCYVGRELEVRRNRAKFNANLREKSEQKV
jgi:hypothetical protein